MATGLKKQNTGMSEDSGNSGANNSLSISDNVIVLEKQFKNKKAHTGDI